MQRIAFLGLGVMGGGMAARRVDTGWPVTVWNRRVAAADALRNRNVPVAASPREAAASADVVISMVADDEASRSVWLGDQGAIAGARPGTLFIESSTVSPAWIAELSAAVTARGCDLIDAPVTGSRIQAATGQLLFLAGGDASAFDRAKPVLAALGRDAWHVGPSGRGAMLKLINNFVCGVQGAALAEAVAMIEKSGLDRPQALRILTEGAPSSPLVKTVSARMTTPDYSVNFELSLMRKDMTYAMRAAEALGLSLKTAAAARERYDEAIAAGLGGQDFAVVVEPLRR